MVQFLRRRRCRRAHCLSVTGFTRLLERQALALHAPQDSRRPLGVADLAMRVPAIELSQIGAGELDDAAQRAVDAALEQGEERLIPASL